MSVLHQFVQLSHFEMLRFHPAKVYQKLQNQNVGAI